MRFVFCLLFTLSALLSAVALAMPGDTSSDTQNANQPSTPQGYHQLTQFALGGDGGWDYLNFDSAAQRLYISRGTRVMVVDAHKGTVVGEVANTPGVHGIALAPKLHRGFTSNGQENSVTVFDTKTLKEVGRVTVGARPDAIVFDPASKCVFTMNAGSGDVSAIDAATMKVVGTIPLPGRPEYAAVDGKGQLFVNIVDKNELVVIDARARKVLNCWSLAPGDHPSGLAIDAKHRRLFAVCSNAMMVVMDADTGHVVATPPIGKGPDAAAFDPHTGMAFSSNGRDGTLTMIHEDSPTTFTVAYTVATQSGARTMALDVRTGKIYLATARFLPPADAAAPPATPPAVTATPIAATSPAAEGPRRMPNIEPNSFVILVYGSDAPSEQPPQHQRGMGGHRHGMG